MGISLNGKVLSFCVTLFVASSGEYGRKWSDEIESLPIALLLIQFLSVSLLFPVNVAHVSPLLSALCPSLLHELYLLSISILENLSPVTGRVHLLKQHAKTF